MSDKSAIGWTSATLNPTTGCTEVSPGCDNCYARQLINTRMVANPKSVRFGHPFGELMLHPERLAQTSRWKTPRLIFVNSLSDLFHRDVPREFIWSVFDSIGRASQHTFQVLTKRPERMRRVVADYYSQPQPNSRVPMLGIQPNVWLGTSIESDAYAWRADMLRETPAAVRFLSLEPLLGSVNKVDFAGIDWVIVGGESGKGHRPMELGWIYDVTSRCAELNIPCFVKQDSGSRPGQRGRLSDYAWGLKQYPLAHKAVPA